MRAYTAPLAVTLRDLIEIRDWRRAVDVDDASKARSWRAGTVHETYSSEDLRWFRAPVGGAA